MIIDDVIDQYVNNFDEESILLLLKCIALPEQGGLGYKLVFFNPFIDLDGYEVDHQLKTIQLDTKGIFSTYSALDVATSLKEGVEVEIAGTQTALLERLTWGTGKVVIGVVEMGVGFVGIIIPEPATTVGGVVLVALGSNSVVDGFSQLSGANKGQGYNILGEGMGAVGAGVAKMAGGGFRIGAHNWERRFHGFIGCRRFLW